MSKIRAFYGSTTGNTANVARLIQSRMGHLVESVADIAGAKADDQSVGLVIDEGNEADLTGARVDEWIRTIEAHFA